ncbi:hypothetical protein GDO81_014944 [Engystomops pustulosus]|uniref:Uncharacterized protein n=1 Tax=Engystomops pustulosus TaxID=76066 RepID=A0AAV7AQN2_ENGPU|nr:hypothetical protein GDO81_014944 [Engystomops pustulosus]
MSTNQLPSRTMGTNGQICSDTSTSCCKSSNHNVLQSHTAVSQAQYAKRKFRKTPVCIQPSSNKTIWREAQLLICLEDFGFLFSF